MADCCKNCRFWDVDDYQFFDFGEAEGKCRRHPPKSKVIPAASIFHETYVKHGWPKTSESDWCGEYEMR